MERLQQTQCARTGNRFGTSSDLQLAEDVLIVSFHRFQGEDKPFANLLIREALRNDLEDFSLASTERLNERLGGGGWIRRGFALVLLSFPYSEQLLDIA